MCNYTDYLGMLFIYLVGLPLGLKVVWSGNIQGTAFNQTLTLGFMSPWEQGWLIGPKVGAGIILGVEEVYRQQLLPGYQLEWVFRDDYCEPQRGMQMAVELWNSVEDLDAIIGPGCSVVCQPVSLLAAAWGIPVVSWVCTSGSLSDKSIYPTFTRVESTWLGLAPCYNALADMLDWNRVGILTTSEDVFRITSEVIKEAMESHGKKVVFRVVDTTVSGEDIIEKNFQALTSIMAEMKEMVRIFFIMSYPQDMRNILIAAHDLGMLNGEYAFVTNEYGIVVDAEYSYRPEIGSALYDGLISVGIWRPSGPGYDHFRQEVIDAFQDPRFADLPHPGPDADIEEIDVYAAYVHDAVLLWAHGVNETLEQGFPVDDGYKITENIFGTSFQGMSGKVTIDDVGDRKLDQRILIIQENFTMVPLMIWDATDGVMVKVLNSGNLSDWSGIHWYGMSSSVPESAPPCGWEMELCAPPADNMRTILMGLIGLAVVLALIATVLMVRKYRYEVDLKAMYDIQIKWQDIELLDSEDHKNTSLHGSIYMEHSDTKRSKVKHAHYQGKIVSIKVIGRNCLNFQDRKVLVDLKEIRDMNNHQNLNNFVGITTTGDDICTVYMYEKRGSLYDVIANVEFKFTLDFITSFIKDIALGMAYLHQGPVGFHGALKSTKVLIDKRWTCKITGHGLRWIKSQIKSKQSDQGTRGESGNSLWTAPELLRSKDVESITEDEMKKADVYSFAIIVSEIVTKSRPYSENAVHTDDHAQHVERVRQGTSPPYRPEIPGNTFPQQWKDLIAKCWHENPNQRLTFLQVLRTLKLISKRDGLNLVDSMIKRLEVETNILEERVAETTEQLNTEKIQVENILCELLPESVAEQLKLGAQIAPELFDNITVFFSDIVGFTRISARGTPMDIVLMLNNMYTIFDEVTNRFDAYKVATIGDAYMVASGVPNRNGDKHAREICRMALALLPAIETVNIPHLPGRHLQMRIGINTGSCVAGVIGKKTPRYLLFGDTIETTAKLESGGEAMKIHISETTKALIENTRDLVTEERGLFTLAGKLHITTYWLKLRN